MAPNTGTIILNGLPNRKIREKVVAFLSHHVKNMTKEKDFDPQVVKAFVMAFDRRDLEVPNVII